MAETMNAASARPAAGLTPRLFTAMQAIQELADRQAPVAPSVQEIADAIGSKSKGSTHRLLTLLSQRGYITFQPYRVRTLAIARRVPAKAAP